MKQQRVWQGVLLLVVATAAAALLWSALIPSLRAINAPFPGFFVHENLTVGPYFLPGWSGQKAGIQSLDRVVALNGSTLKGRADLYALVKSAPAGTPFQYTVIRSHSSIEVTIPSMRFAFGDWFLIFGVYILMGVAFLVIGAAPYYYRASSPAAVPLCFMVIAVFVWFETTFDFVTAGALPRELRIFGLTLTPSAAIHLAWLLTSGEPLRRRHPVALASLYGIALAIGALTSVTFFGPLDWWVGFFRAGYVYTCIGALSFLLIIGYALRGPLTALERSRLRVMFVGALFGFLIPTVATVLTSSFHWSIPYNLALVPTICFPLSVAYALLKYSLFDLGNTLKIALSRFALTVALLAIYAIVVDLVGPWAGIFGSDPLVPLLFSILVVLVFNPLLRRIEAVVDRYVYSLDYDPVLVQNQISLFLRSLAASPALAQGFTSKLAHAAGLESVTLAYQPKAAPELLLAAGRGGGVGTAEASAMCTLLATLPIDCAGAIARSELTAHPRFDYDRQRWLQNFNSLSAELVIPLVFEKQIRGFVALGRKVSKKEYHGEDLRLFSALTDQVALSLENARLYDESVQAFRRAEAANQKLLEMDRIKKHFVANICHEIRTPVSTIIGYGEILADRNFKGDSQAILERLVNNGQELSSLMDNLMNFSRIEEDGASAHLETVKLREVLAGVKIMTERLVRERPIRVDFRMDARIETIETDAQKLQQILVELATNAVKFTAKGRIDLSARSTRGAGDEFIEIAIADSGVGIRQEDQALVFEDFRQLDGSSSRHYGGTGVGLGLCKKLAAALGGKISLASEPNVGSTFSLWLPLKPPPLELPRTHSGALLHALN